MERRFYNDDSFEQFLKDATENFRMYPNKKVWHSIYNNIHPSRKWPSLSALLLLISSVMFIGVSNTRQIQGKDAAYIASLNLQIDPMQPHFANENNSTSLGSTELLLNDDAVVNTIQFSDYLNKETFNEVSLSVTEEEISLSSDEHLNNKGENSLQMNGTFAMQVFTPTPITDELIAEEKTPEELVQNTSLIALNEKDEVATTPFVDVNMDVESTVSKEEMKVAEEVIKVDEKTNQKNWVDEYAFYNLKQLKKKKNPWSMHAYVTPSFGYRTLSSNANFNAHDHLPNLLLTNVSQPNQELAHNPAINFELGGGLYYNLNKTIRLKTGIQMNFTSYKINAFGLTHAAMASVMMNGPESDAPMVETRPTFLSATGNGNEIQLTSSTMQFSVPIGADFRIAGNKDITWYAGATIQPSYVAGGNAFIISADEKHYIADATILRRFNLNAGLETFISYQPMKGLRLNVGPQFRYQLMSTYKADYPMNERLYNIGIKFGITTRF